MNDFDQGGRYQVKNNPKAHLAWLFPRTWKVMDFGGWMDSQSARRVRASPTVAATPSPSWCIARGGCIRGPW